MVKLYLIAYNYNWSAFDAAELCDSHLFQLKIFSLDLPKRINKYLKVNVFLVLLANIAQFILKLMYLTIFTTNINTNITCDFGDDSYCQMDERTVLLIQKKMCKCCLYLRCEIISKALLF